MTLHIYTCYCTAYFDHLNTYLFHILMGAYNILLGGDINLVDMVQQCISEPVYYGNLAYKLKTIVRKPSFPDQCQVYVFGWTHWGSAVAGSLALVDFELRALFFVLSQYDHW